MSKILSIVVTFNSLRYDWLQKCIESLQNSTIETDIIVIDNNSSDETCKIIKEKYKNVQLVESNENLGFGKANNIGLEKALNEDYDFVLLLNQDAWVEKNTLEKLVDHSKKNTEYGIISPLHLNPHDGFLDSEFLRQISPQFSPDLVSDFILKKDTDKIYNSPFICAAAWLITKKCLKIVGGFNPSFFHYGEDNNYAHRVLYKGLKIGVYPHAKIYHDRRRAKDWNFGTKSYASKRNYLINLSDPNKEIDKHEIFRHLRISLLKSFFKNNKSQTKQIRNEITFFKKNIDSITNNLKQSKIQNHAFLNIKNNKS